MHLASYLGLLHLSELELARAYLAVAADHGHEPDVDTVCRRFADQCTASADAPCRSHCSANSTSAISTARLSARNPVYSQM